MSPSSTDVLADLRRELAHPIMAQTGSGEVEIDVLQRAAAEIERLRARVAELEVALVSGHRTWAQLKRYTHLKPAWVARKYLDARPNLAGPDAADDGLADAKVPGED